MRWPCCSSLCRGVGLWAECAVILPLSCCDEAHVFVLYHAITKEDDASLFQGSRERGVLLRYATLINPIKSLPSDQILPSRSISDRHSGNTASAARKSGLGWDIELV